MDRRPASQKSLPPRVLSGHGHTGCVCPTLPAVLVGGMQPLCAAWVSSWVEMKDMSRKMKLNFSLKPSVSAAPSCSELLMCSLRGAWVSENYCFSRCTAVCILPALITWCGWYWLGRDAGTELGKKLQFLLLRGEIFTFGTCLEASLDVRAGCW